MNSLTAISERSSSGLSGGASGPSFSGISSLNGVTTILLATQSAPSRRRILAHEFYRACQVELFQDQKRGPDLVDIVVMDRNLHAAFLCDRAFDGPTAKALGPWRTDIYNSGVAGARGKVKVGRYLPRVDMRKRRS